MALQFPLDFNEIRPSLPSRIAQPCRHLRVPLFQSAMNEVARYSPESNSFQSLLTNRPLLGCLAGLGAGRGMSGARAMINLPEQTDFLSVGEGALPCIIARRDRIAIAGASPRPRRARSGGGAGCCCSTVVIVDAHVNVADVASFGRRPPRPLPIPSKMVFGFSRSVDESYPPRRHSRPRRGREDMRERSGLSDVTTGGQKRVSGYQWSNKNQRLPQPRVVYCRCRFAACSNLF